MLVRLFVFFVFCSISALTYAQKAEIYSADGAAIRGYDPVAYFTDGKPLKGAEKFSYQWKGATWRFASAENRDRFAGAPEKYAPQYGGYCAYGVASGYAVSIDPAAWTVRDGKLYLNYSAGVQKDWLKDVPGYIRKADANWPRVLR
jgi:YHS domain-containing protein